ncbi:Heavy metal-associated isoprenylated plant protein 22, partial [Bienertia sinuspersici]
VKSVEVNRKQSKVTVTGYVDPKRLLKKLKDTGKITVEFWPYIEHNLVPYPYVTGAYDKRAPSVFVKDVPQAYHSLPSFNLPQQPIPNLFSDDNPNSCSIMSFTFMFISSLTITSI